MLPDHTATLDVHAPVVVWNKSSMMMRRDDVWSPVAIGICLAGAYILRIVVGALPPHDFAMFHATARALAEGRAAYEPHALVDGVWRNMNPPQFHLVLMPFIGLALPTAATWFRAVNLVALVVSMAVLFTPRELCTRRAGWVVAAAIMSPALMLELSAGQVAGILALALSCAWLALRGSHAMLAGALIGAVCAVKPNLLPIMAWLVFARRWRSVAAALVAATVLIVVSIILWGLGPQREWLHAVASVTWFDSRFNASGLILIQRLTAYPVPYRLFAIASGALSLVIAARAARLPARSAFLLCLVASFAVAPLGWLYYLSMVGPLLMRWTYDGGRLPVGAWLLWVPLQFVPQLDDNYLLRATISSVYAWGAVALLFTNFSHPSEPSGRPTNLTTRATR